MSIFYISNDDVKSLAQFFLPYIIEFYESEEGKREFDEWKQSKENDANVKEIENRE